MKWIPIFKAGDYPQGKLTTADIKKVISNYDTTLHQAPLVIGHPDEDAPAYGWVAKLKLKGDTLFATFEKVAKVVSKWLDEGRYKNISTSFYRNLADKGPYLRHVGLLGATPPAVKGLSVASFADVDDDVIITYDEQPQSDTTDGDTNTGNGLNSLKDEIINELRAIISNEIAKQLTALFPTAKKPNDSAGGANTAFDAVKFSEGLKQQGKLLPAWEDSIIQFIATLSDDISIANGNKNQRQWFINFLESSPPVIDLSMTPISSRARSISNVSYSLSERVSKLINQSPHLTYTEAIAIINESEPELINAYVNHDKTVTQSQA